ncbi:MAG: MFS transporter [Nitrososphaerota archaeon]|nr:MFS transporter [Nitrososphaerota archaeon]MDG6946201.1 MFS transporter [Nitrososphaerota archaeon]
MSMDKDQGDGRATDTRSLAFLATLRVFRSVSAGMINVAFPFLVLTELHLGADLLGLMYASATIATALLGLGIGIAADLIGRRVTFVVALALLPLSAFLVVTSTSVPSLFVAAVVGGISATGSLSGGGVGGAAQPIQSVLTTELTSRKDRTRYYSLLAFISGVASAAGAYLGGFGGIQEVFAIAAVLGVASVLITPLVKMEKSARRRFTLKSGAAIGKFSLTGMLNGLSQGLITPFLIPFFILLYSVTRQQMNVYAAASGLIASFALLLAPRIERKLGFLRGMIATRGFSVALSVIMPLVRLLPVSLFIYFVLPATRVMALPVQQAAMMDMVSERERGTAFGINQTTRLVASSGGTYFSGFEFAAVDADPMAIDYPFALYAIVLGLNLGLYWWFFRRYRPPPVTTAESGK